MLGHIDPLFTSFGFYMTKAPFVSTHQHGLGLLLWGYFALILGCVCLFQSKNKDLFPFPPPTLSQKSSGVSSLYLEHPLFSERKETAPSRNELRI